MHTRLSLLMQVTTAPIDTAAARQHTGGWSESAWIPGQQTSGASFITTWARLRANMLPKQASVVGVRLAYYNLVGNKILPVGTQTGKLSRPGSSALETDLPQVALELSGKTADGPNTSRLALRCIPDDMMKYGEYQPTPSFKTAVTAYCAFMSAAQVFGFVGRDLSKPSQRVLSIAAGVLTLDAALPGVGIGSWIRLNRVYDTQENPVTGVYRVTAVNAAVYTLADFPAVTVATSGTAREDAVAFFDFSTITPARAVVRKVGSPFEKYVGRASKRNR